MDDYSIKKLFFRIMSQHIKISNFKINMLLVLNNHVIS